MKILIIIIGLILLIQFLKIIYRRKSKQQSCGACSHCYEDAEHNEIRCIHSKECSSLCKKFNQL